MKQENKKYKKFGFTLIELLVVIAIIGILATLAVISYTGVQKQARDTKRKSDLKQYQVALESYAAKNAGSYPARVGGGSIDSSLCATLGVSACPQDPVLESPYVYSYTSDGSSFTLSSTLETKDSTSWVADSNGKAYESTTTPPSQSCSGCISDEGCQEDGASNDLYCGTGGVACVNCYQVYGSDARCFEGVCQVPPGETL